MAASSKITDFLKKNNISFEVLEHPPAYTAQEIAGKQHISGKQFVKAVIVEADGKVVMCVLPAIHLIDFDSLKKLIGAEDITLVSEGRIAEIFPDYEVGAEPPFGNLYGLDVYVDKFLENDDEIVFNAGSHTQVIKMKYQDFIDLVSPKVAKFGTHI